MADEIITTSEDITTRIDAPAGAEPGRATVRRRSGKRAGTRASAANEGKPPSDERRPENPDQKGAVSAGDATSARNADRKQGQGGGSKDSPSSRVPKAEQVLTTLRRKRGASITELCEITGWQAHSVRGFLSGNVKKKLELVVTSDVGKDGVRRYRIDGASQAG